MAGISFLLAGYFYASHGAKVPTFRMATSGQDSLDAHLRGVVYSEGFRRKINRTDEGCEGIRHERS